MMSSVTHCLSDATLSTDSASQVPVAATQSLLLLAAALDDPHGGLIIFDASRNALHVTSHTARILGFDQEQQSSPATVLDLLRHSALEPRSAQTAQETIVEFGHDSPAISVLLRRREPSGRVRMKLRSIGAPYFVASFHPETNEQEAAMQAALDLALRDSLTGLASRHHFEWSLSEVLARKPDDRVTVLLLDLDRFKAVNDTLGHAAGDTLLRLVSERLKSAVRKDDLVARLGGDEFGILLDLATDTDQTIAIAQRILDLIQRTYLIQGQLVNVGTSIGIAQAAPGNDSATLLRNADLALYQSKSSGRATYTFFESEMEQRAQARRTSELELRKALALRQLELFYQPQVDAAKGRLVGFEALLRWRHPERGMIPPSEFLPIAEEVGVIVPIGDWVLRTACKEAAKWPGDITIAVNASPLQFETGNFAKYVKRALAGSGLPGERLEIEITEGIMLRNDRLVMETLHQLRAMKVRIAMDDFGTGYASLSQLARFPFDKIKIDRSLAGFEGENPKQRSIVRAISSLGRSLGVSTLAEGVESWDQLERLQIDGCTAVQGYLFSKPVPTSDLAGIFEQYHMPAGT